MSKTLLHRMSLNIDKTTYTSVLKERHFSSGNTAVPVTRPHALRNVIIHNYFFLGGLKLYIVYSFFLRTCLWFCTFQLHCNSSNLDTTQDMYKFTDKMPDGNDLQVLTCWAASFWSLLGLRACLQFGQSPYNSIKNVMYIYLLVSTHWV